MKNLTKSLIGAGAAAAALVGSVAPAQARDGKHDGISAGEVIAGAVILGGLAAIIASSDNDHDRDYDRDYRYNDRRYGHGYDYDAGRGNSRHAVNQCINGVERWSGRYSRSKVTEIKDIDRTRRGYVVKGKLVVKDGWRGRDRYDRGYERGYDKGRFTCYVERGRVVDIDYRGLDKWR